MINEEYSGHIQALRYAAIECLIATQGDFNSQHLADIFTTHRCNASKIVKRYIQEVNLDIMYYPHDKRYKPLPGYSQHVLKDDTNPYTYLKILNQLHGKEVDADVEQA